MADKRLRVIVEAVTSQAQAAFKSMGNTVRGFSDQASRDIAKVTGATEGAGQSMISFGQVVAAAVAAIVATYAKMAIESAFSLAEMAASNLDLAEGYDTVTKRMGIAGDKLVEQLQAAARGTIGAYQTMGLTIKAVDLGIAASTDDLVKLMEIAHVRAKRYGMSTAEAFELLVNGISSGRPMMLRHLGFLADTEQAYDRVAQSMGKDADELTLLQQKQAVFQAILETGQDDLEAWNATIDDASDAYERQRIAVQKLKQAIGEELIPTTATLAEKLSTLPTILDQLGYAVGVYVTGTSASLRELWKELKGGDWEAIMRNQALAVGEMAMEQYALQDAMAKAPDSIGEMVGALTHARDALVEYGKSADATGTDQEELDSALKKGQAAWADYGRSVAEETWRYTQRVDDAQFSMKQAAERALFDMMKIERDGAQRRDDLLESESIRDQAETASHYDKLRYLKQDLMDSLMDMEWDYQGERRAAMDKAPWWIRQALAKEFAERERIAGTGDREALEQYDKTLMARIKAIDPVYAKELGLLDEQYEHKEDIEKREGRQSLDREKDAWRISEREQQRNLDQQLSTLDRELGEQRAEWAFHDYQRNESEQRSMEQLGIEYEHSLGNLWMTTQAKLADLPPLYKHYGYENWVQFIQGWEAGQADIPLTIPGADGGGGGAGPKRHQAGAWDIPRNELAFLHKGEMVIPARAAQQVREGGGGVNITIHHLTVSGGRAGARQFVNAVEEELGQGIRARSR